MFARFARRDAARGAERAVSSAAALPAARARGGAGASAARIDAPRALERGLRTLAHRGCASPATARQGDAVACARDATLLRCSPAMYDARRGWKKAHRRVEVILTTPIDGLGDADETVSVRPGRARNHLVPGKLATYVNAEKLEAANARRAAREAAEMSEDGEGEASGRGEDADVARERKAGDLVIKMLTSDPPIVFKRIIDKKTGKPRLAVTRENIVEQVARQKKLALSPASLVLSDALTEYGEYEIPLWIKGHPRGSHVLPVTLRKKL